MHWKWFSIEYLVGKHSSILIWKIKIVLNLFKIYPSCTPGTNGIHRPLWTKGVLLCMWPRSKRGVRLESEGDRANADLQYQKLWRTLQRFARETQVSAAEVQWTRLAMKEPPTWSRLPPAQVSMSWKSKGKKVESEFERMFMARGERTLYYRSIKSGPAFFFKTTTTSRGLLK